MLKTLVLENSFLPMSSAWIKTSDFTYFDIHPRYPFDEFSLQSAARLCMNLFPATHNTIFLLSDPLLSGNFPSTLTLAKRISKPYDSWIVAHSEENFSSPGSVIQQNGTEIKKLNLRIPPTPLCENAGSLAPEFIEQISSFAPCAKDFKAKLEQALNKLESVERRIEKFNQFPTLEHSLESLVQRTWREYSSGSVVKEIFFAPGEKVKLKLSLKNTQLELDFTGTSPFAPQTSGWQLGSLHTQGLCLNAIRSSFNWPLLSLNSLHSRVHVTLPVGSVLNSKSETLLTEGIFCGSAVVLSLLKQCLSELFHRTLGDQPLPNNPAVLSISVNEDQNPATQKVYNFCISNPSSWWQAKPGDLTLSQVLRHLGVDPESIEASSPVGITNSFGDEIPRSGSANSFVKAPTAGVVRSKSTSGNTSLTLKCSRALTISRLNPQGKWLKQTISPQTPFQLDV